MNDVIIMCVILHNMIVEDEWGQDLEGILFADGFQVDDVNHDRVTSLIDFSHIRKELMNELGHYQLQNDVIEYLWAFHHGAINF